MLHLDAADAEDEVDLALREVVRDLVGGDAVFVEPAGPGALLEDGDVVTLAGQGVGTRQAGGTGADDGDALAGGGRRW